MAISLASLRRGPQARPPRIVVMGVHGVGKSTFASKAPAPVFIQTEEGLDALNVTAFPLARSYGDVVEAIGTLCNEEHEFQTVVIDSLDWLEQLIHKDVAERSKVDSIESIGYGKGYTIAVDNWLQILEGLDVLRNQKRMAVVLLAHANVKRFDSPESEPFDRYVLDLHKGAASVVLEWCDVAGFANYRHSIEKTDVGFKKKIARGVGFGERLLYTQERPAYAGMKSRYNIPPELPLEYSELNNAIITSLTPEIPL